MTEKKQDCEHVFMGDHTAADGSLACCKCGISQKQSSRPTSAAPKEDGEVDPPCGEQCPKDEDCGNFNFHGEGCMYNPKLPKEKIWEAIHALSQSRFKFKTPMAADREGAGLFTKEQADLIDTCLIYAYHKAQEQEAATRAGTKCEGGEVAEAANVMRTWAKNYQVIHQRDFPFLNAIETLITAAQRSQAAEDGWRPIETAPRDGAAVFVAIPWDNSDGWITGEAKTHDTEYGPAWYWMNLDPSDYHADVIYPRMWQPLPAPPIIKPKDEVKK